MSVYSALSLSFQPKFLVFVSFHSEPESFLPLLESEETLFHEIVPVLRVFGILLPVIAVSPALVIETFVTPHGRNRHRIRTASGITIRCDHFGKRIRSIGKISHLEITRRSVHIALTESVTARVNGGRAAARTRNSRLAGTLPVSGHASLHPGDRSSGLAGRGLTLHPYRSWIRYACLCRYSRT